MTPGVPAVTGSAGRRAALFDMDRTLLRRDSGSLYVRWQRDIGAAGWRDGLRVAWWVLQYRLGVLAAERVAARVLEDLAGEDEAEFRERCRGFYRDYLRPHVTEAGRRAVRAHHARGDLVAIVTGATRYAAGPLAEELGIEHVVCTELETARGRFTGRIEQPMCYGAGKTVLARRWAERHGVTLGEAVFYTDSITDRPLCEHVGEAVVVNPDARLGLLARRRGWRRESW
ncbi:MAG: HAD family hydrolase [Myxococcales bacterium]|nr:HAD family hydrolase [Myxococcales bacterium]